MMRCPFAAWIGSPNFGYPRGAHGQNRPIAIVDHMMQGYLAGCDSWFRNPESWSSTHFGIGKGGALHQYVDTDNAAYANGAVDKPDAAGAALAALGNPNVLTVSIEHEGFSGEPWTEAMYQADLRLKRWLLATHGKMGESHVLLLMGHYQIDSVDRRNCPGPTWPKERLLADLEEDDMALEERMVKLERGLEMEREKQDIRASLEHWLAGYGEPDVESLRFRDFVVAHIAWRLRGKPGWVVPA